MRFVNACCKVFFVVLMLSVCVSCRTTKSSTRTATLNDDESGPLTSRSVDAQASASLPVAPNMDASRSATSPGTATGVATFSLNSVTCSSSTNSSVSCWGQQSNSACALSSGATGMCAIADSTNNHCTCVTPPINVLPTFQSGECSEGTSTALACRRQKIGRACDVGGSTGVCSIADAYYSHCRCTTFNGQPSFGSDRCSSSSTTNLACRNVLEGSSCVTAGNTLGACTISDFYYKTCACSLLPTPLNCPSCPDCANCPGYDFIAQGTLGTARVSVAAGYNQAFVSPRVNEALRFVPQAVTRFTCSNAGLDTTLTSNNGVENRVFVNISNLDFCNFQLPDLQLFRASIVRPVTAAVCDFAFNLQTFVLRPDGTIANRPATAYGTQVACSAAARTVNADSGLVANISYQCTPAGHLTISTINQSSQQKSATVSIFNASYCASQRQALLLSRSAVKIDSLLGVCDFQLNLRRFMLKPDGDIVDLGTILYGNDVKCGAAAQVLNLGN